MTSTKSTARVFCFALALAVLQTAFSTRPNNGGWDSDPFNDYRSELANEPSNDINSRASMSDLLKPSYRSTDGRATCDMDRMLYCFRRVLQTEMPENSTYASCRGVLNKVLEPESFQPVNLVPVCRAYMEVNLCADQTHCEINAVLIHIERNRRSFPPHLKQCYEVSRKACTDVKIGPTPFSRCFACTNCCNGCFGNDATVLTEDGRRLKMTELSVGDRVLAADQQTGVFFYDEVLTFLHQDVNNKLRNFVYLSLANDAEVSLTPYHLIYVATEEELNISTHGIQATLGQPKYAIDVKPGDFVFTADSSGNENQITEVLAVNLKFVRSGIFAPLTASGHIVVDDVLMSCYAVSRSHKLVHWFMKPLIAYYKISNKLPPLLPWSWDWLSTHNEDGLHRYADVLLNAFGAVPFLQSFKP